MTGVLRNLKPLRHQSGELIHLDFLRLIACYAVILVHFIQFSQGTLLPVMLHLRHVYLMVDLFIAMSGFIISAIYDNRVNSHAAYGTFLLRRVARIAPLHWATLAFFVVLGLIAALLKARGSHLAGFVGHLSNYDTNCLIPNILALQAFGVCRQLSFNYVSWSISAEFGMYLIAPALLWLGHRSRWWPMALSLALIVLLTCAPLGFKEPWYELSWDFGVLRALPSFALGVALFFFRRDVGRLPAPRLFFLGAIALFIIGSYLEWSDLILLLFAYGAVIAGIACDITVRRRDWISALGVYGQLTYSMYLLHPILIVFFMNIVGQHIFHLHGLAMNLWLFVVVGAVAPVSYLSLELFESPARRWISGAQRRHAKVVLPAPTRTFATVGHAE